MSSGAAMRRALVTGASGFVGSRLVYRLVSDGWQVSAILRPGSSLGELVPVLPHIQIVRVSGGEDLRGVVAAADPDVVFHLASKFLAEHRPEDVADLIDSNVRFGTLLLEAMAENQVSRLVNAGTSWQHYATSDYRPVCLYAATKQAFEAILDYYVDACSVRAVTLKLSDTYGPSDPRRKLFSAFRSARESEAPIAFSPGEQLIDLVYIDDVVDAFLRAAGRLLSGDCSGKEEFGVSLGSPRSLREIASIYESVVGRALKIDWGARPYRSREVMSPWSSGRPVPGWQPKVSLAEGIRRTERIAATGWEA